MKHFFLRYKSYYVNILQLGIPIVLGQLGIIIMGFADNIMVGQHNTNELSAASFVNNIINLALIFGLGFSLGLTPVISTLFGQNHFFKIGHVLKNGLCLNLCMAFCLTSIMGCVLYNLEKLGQPEELYILIRPYFLLQIVSLPFIMFSNVFKQFYDGITNTRTSMWILLTGNFINIVGNYLFIYGKYGFPELGLIGAGLSTLLARITTCVAFYMLFQYSEKTAEYRKGFWQKPISSKKLKQIGHISFPIGMQMSMETASFSLSAIMMGWIGSVALAAHQIMSTMTTIGFMVYYGIGAATSIKIGYHKGKNDYHAVHKSAYACFHLITICACIVNFIIWLGKDQIGYLFTNSDEVAQLTALLCIPTIIYQFGDGLQVTFANALRGIGDVKMIAYMAFFSYFIVSLPLSYLFGFIYDKGALGVWWAFPFGLTCAGILYFLRFYWGKSK